MNVYSERVFHINIATSATNDVHLSNNEGLFTAARAPEETVQVITSATGSSLTSKKLAVKVPSMRYFICPPAPFRTYSMTSACEREDKEALVKE